MKEHKFVFTSDIHLHIHRDAPLAWSQDRYRQLFQVIVEACLTNNATLLLGGDIAHSTSLKLEELDLILEFFHLLEENKINTILVSGNHCEVGTDKSIFDYLKLDTFGPRKGFSYIHYNEGPIIFDEEIIVYPVSHFEINSYDYSRVPKDKFTILLSHIRCEIPPHITAEAPLEDIADNFTVCLLGDIHHEHSPFENVFYSNSPINNIYDTNPNNSFVVLSVRGNDYSIERVRTNLPSLVSIQTNVENFCQDTEKLDLKNWYKVTVEGSLAELKKLPNSLPNGKIVKVPESQIVYDAERELEEDNPLTPHLSLEAELVGYMQTLNYEDIKITQMVDLLREI